MKRATIMIAATISSLIGTIFALHVGRMTTLTLFASAAIILAIPTLNGLHDSTTLTQRMLCDLVTKLPLRGRGYNMDYRPLLPPPPIENSTRDRYDNYYGAAT